nr:hypothetical protein GCM10020093_048330 [Planobispora longispora]
MRRFPAPPYGGKVSVAAVIVRTVDGTAVTGGLTFAEGRPGAFLRPYVTELSAYAERYEEPLIRRQPPFAGVVVIFGLGEPIGLSGPGTRERLASFAGGLHDVYVDTVIAGATEGVQVNLTPSARAGCSACR